MAVIDASVAVKFVAEEQGSAHAQALLRSDESLVAPDWVLVEAANAFWKKVRSGAMTQAGAKAGLAAVPEFFQILHPSPALLSAAYDLAFELDHWLYDCLYLALAVRENMSLVTADEAFWKVSTRGGFGDQVMLLGEMKMEKMSGGCMCGRIRYSALIENDEAYLCHCRMCQRASGNVSLAMKNAKKAAVSWEQEPDYYASSPIARRGFCSACGTSLTFEFPDSENLDLIVGTFDDPSRFRPVHHFGVESMHRAWLNTDGLPEYRVDEYKPVVDRWMKTVGKLPD